MGSGSVTQSTTILAPETVGAPAGSKQPQPVLLKELSTLKKENERLHLELAGRPSQREWKMAQHRIKDLETELMSHSKVGSHQALTRKLIRNDKVHHLLDRNAQEVVKVDSDESSEIIKVCVSQSLFRC